MEKQPQLSRINKEDENKNQNHNKNKKEDNNNKIKSNPISPPSASSSPSHEFSFTISLHPHSNISHSQLQQQHHNSFAIDLSPADEIFFHGHLLPLHLLSNLPVSPRFSTDSLDSFTLPIKELSDNQTSTVPCTTTTDHEYINIDHFHFQYPDSCSNSGVLQDKVLPPAAPAPPGKPKSFSLFGIPKWRNEKGRQENDQKQSKKPKFQLSNAVKRYMRLINPFLSLRSKGMETQFIRQTNSLSGNLRVKSKKELRGRRGEFSAPASMRTSPANSGLLVATGTSTPTSTTDSTMEELQAAIQSAIAHCKKSIATEDQLKMQ